MTSESILKPGVNCAEVARAKRVALLVDAQAYFAAFKRACENAERSIVVLGWDFDSRTVLECDEHGGGQQLGDFLNDLVRRKKLAEKLGRKPNDWDLIEANEAFAAQAIVDARELGWDFSKLNVHGGAVALGHPIGASGARVLTTLLYAMRDRKAKTGLATLCLGGGNAVALSVEAV